MTYEQIVYPTDGSTGSDAALDEVRTLASAHDATVHVLSVVDTRDVGFGMTGGHHDDDPGMSGGHQTGDDPGMVGTRLDADAWREALSAEGRELVADRAAALDEVETVTAVRHGDPHETIIEYADDVDADVIVMGTHGRTGLDRRVLGSVTERTVRLSDVPVLTVRAGDE